MGKTRVDSMGLLVAVCQGSGAEGEQGKGESGLHDAGYLFVMCEFCRRFDLIRSCEKRVCRVGMSC